MRPFPRAGRWNRRKPATSSDLLPMNLPLWSADAHVRSPLTRTWASGLQKPGSSRAEIAAVGGPLVLSMNLPQIQGGQQIGISHLLASLNLLENLGGSPSRRPLHSPGLHRQPA